MVHERSIIAAVVTSWPKISAQAEKGLLLVTIRLARSSRRETSMNIRFRGVRVKRDVGAQRTRTTPFRGNPVPQRPDLRTLRAGRDVGDPCRRVRSSIRNGYPADGARRDSAQSGSVPVPGGLDAAVSSGGAAAV